VQVYDVSSGTEVATYRRHDKALLALAFTPDGKRILSLDRGGGLKHWNAAHGPEALVITQGNGAWDATLSPDGRRVAAAALDTAVHLWDADSGEELRKFSEAITPRKVAFSPDGGILAAALGKIGGGAVVLWDVQTGALNRRLPDSAQGQELAAAIDTLAFSPDGKRIAAGTQERAVHVWDTGTGQEVFRMGGHASTVSTVAFSHDGRRLLSLSGGYWWQAPRGRPNPLGLKDDPQNAIPDLKVWDAASGEEILARSVPKLRGVAVSPAGEVTAVELPDNRVQLSNVTTGEEVLVLRARGNFWSCAFSPDGKRLVTTDGDDAVVKIWDAMTGEEFLTLRHRGLVSSVSFSRNGRKIVAASHGEIRVWDGTPLKN
jgi:WD40 repeat protein